MRARFFTSLKHEYAGVHARVIRRMRAKNNVWIKSKIFSPRVTHTSSRNFFFFFFFFFPPLKINDTRRKVPYTLKIPKSFHDNFFHFFFKNRTAESYPKTINIDNIPPQRERRGAYLPKNFVRVNGSGPWHIPINNL